ILRKTRANGSYEVAVHPIEVVHSDEPREGTDGWRRGNDRRRMGDETRRGPSSVDRHYGRDASSTLRSCSACVARSFATPNLSSARLNTDPRPSCASPYPYL